MYCYLTYLTFSRHALYDLIWFVVSVMQHSSCQGPEACVSMWSAGKKVRVGRKDRPVQKLFISFLSFWTDVGYANDDFAC